MKYPAFLLSLLLVLLSRTTYAETVYISDELRVPLRKTPCSSCSIVHRGLRAGTTLTIIEKSDEWTQVSTRSGLTGWVPNQYLVNQPIARDRLAQVEAQNATLTQQNSELKASLEALQATHSETENLQLEAVNTQEQLQEELATIKKISGNALALQEQNDELVKANRMLQSEVDVLRASKEQLERNATQRWFLYGGLAVFLGALLATIIPHLKPRRRFSEWG